MQLQKQFNGQSLVNQLVLNYPFEQESYINILRFPGNQGNGFDNLADILTFYYNHLIKVLPIPDQIIFLHRVGVNFGSNVEANLIRAIGANPLLIKALSEDSNAVITNDMPKAPSDGERNIAVSDLVNATDEQCKFISQAVSQRHTVTVLELEDVVRRTINRPETAVAATSAIQSLGILHANHSSSLLAQHLMFSPEQKKKKKARKSSLPMC